MTIIEIKQRMRMMSRAFKWNIPLPANYCERMDAYDNGENKREEMWYPPYRLNKRHENMCAEQSQYEYDKWMGWINKLDAE